MALLPFGTEGSDEPTVVDLLRKDHETVKQLFRDFESAEEPDQQAAITRRMLKELETHARVEEKIFYPAVREDSPDAGPKLDESREEHHVARLLMHELSRMSPDDPRFAAKVRVLAESVRHHIKEEEAEIFARARTGKLDLIELGRRLEAEKRTIQASLEAEPKVEPAKPRRRTASTKTKSRTSRSKGQTRKSKGRAA